MMLGRVDDEFDIRVVSLWSGFFTRLFIRFFLSVESQDFIMAGVVESWEFVFFFSYCYWIDYVKFLYL